MLRETELKLIDELLALKSGGGLFLEQAVARNPVENYASQRRFERERRLMQSLPRPLIHASELAEPGAFVRHNLLGLPVLLTRDEHGVVHALVNVCRHRGTRLVDAAAGCQHRFVCPYHAWTYNSSGALIAAPHFEQGFGGLDRDALGLKSLPCQERFGLIWVQGLGDDSLDLDVWLGSLAPELEALRIENMRVAHSDERPCAANWKLLIEGGIEAYHFRCAHRQTIGPHFEDNLSTFENFGPHMRSVLARSNISGLDQLPREQWRLRDHANLVYSLFPTDQLLLSQDHITWIAPRPISAQQSLMRMTTLVPTDGPLAAGKDAAHWRRNHRISVSTFTEDMQICERIQSGVDAGACQQMLFGRFEGALRRFNQVMDDQLARLESA